MCGHSRNFDEWVTERANEPRNKSVAHTPWIPGTHWHICISTNVCPQQHSRTCDHLFPQSPVHLTYTDYHAQTTMHVYQKLHSQWHTYSLDTRFIKHPWSVNNPKTIGWCLLITYCVLTTVLGILHSASHSNLIKSQEIDPLIFSYLQRQN